MPTLTRFFGERLSSNLKRSPLFVAYLVLIVLIFAGFLYMEHLTSRIEANAAIRGEIQCIVGNDTRRVLAEVLDEMAAAQETDGPGDFEQRQRLRARLDPLLLPKDCSILDEGELAEVKSETAETRSETRSETERGAQ